ncbi:MAG TPA: isochorismate synthase [Acidimicrobiales bacterium]|nr:isochorismate synthase [Acidimicrobiales bacterium]
MSGAGGAGQAVSGAPARLVGAPLGRGAGAPGTDHAGRSGDSGIGDLRTEDLAYTAGGLDEAAVAAFRRLAEVDGRVLEREGFALLSLGEAARIELPHGLRAEGAAEHAATLLAAIPPADGAASSAAGGSAAGAGAGPGAGSRPPEAARLVALGALPFETSVSGTLVIPEMCVMLRSETPAVVIACGTRQRLGELGSGFPLRPGAPAPAPRPLQAAPDRFELASVRSHDEYEQLVALAVAEIAAGHLDKVVCAREVLVTANCPFEQAHLLERLRALYPACCAFALDGFVGASPELLVRRNGDDVLSQPLAGTIPRSGDPDEDARLAGRLLASPKERREHALVVSAIERALAGLGGEVTPSAAPHLLALRNVTHLATTIHARLRPPLPGVLAVVAALAPTPAVGGVPTPAALRFLAAHEHLERDRYAGTLGFLDASGDGEWWLGLRSALVEGRRARLIAGSGIVEGSDPHDELVETQLKLQALLAAAVRP